MIPETVEEAELAAEIIYGVSPGLPVRVLRAMVSVGVAALREANDPDVYRLRFERSVWFARDAEQLVQVREVVLTGDVREPRDDRTVTVTLLDGQSWMYRGGRLDRVDMPDGRIALRLVGGDPIA